MLGGEAGHLEMRAKGVAGVACGVKEHRRPEVGDARDVRRHVDDPEVGREERIALDGRVERYEKTVKIFVAEIGEESGHLVS
jgi:hypothetical protein